MNDDEQKSGRALVIIDMQNAFINKYTDHLPKKIVDFIEENQNTFDRIITTTYENYQNTACYIFEGWKECMAGTADAELIPELKDRRYSNVTKHKYSAYDVDLRNLIWGLHLKEIFLCGVNTGCCVLHTAFDMYNDLVSTYVIEDLCGSTSGPESHRTAIQVLKECITKQRVITSRWEGFDMSLSREDRIRRRYEAELAELHQEQNTCQHEWDNVMYDPEIKNEPCGYKTVTQGSDVWAEPIGYHEVTYPRWSRTCKKCGKVEYTTENVAVKYEPRFN